MRFLCEQCKAKYQISDEKVAGKTVRMKCRKCGHMIEVRSEVTESSVANAVPGAAQAGGGGGAPRPAGLKPAPPRSKLATNLTSSPAAKPSLAPGALAGAFNRTVEGAPASSMRPASPDDSAALDLLSASTAPWYVAINGVPVGPVRLSELRRKAASGLVNESSLCWQDGNEEWRPVKTFPELAALVREAAASGRPSLLSSPPFAPNGDRASALPPSPAAPPVGQRGNAPRAPAAPRSPAAPAARNNVVPIGGRTPNPNATAEINISEVELSDYAPTRVEPNAAAGFAAAADPFAAPPRPSVAPDPFAAPAFGAPAAFAPPPPAQVVVTPLGAAPGAPYAATTLAQPAAMPLSLAPAPPKRERNLVPLALFAAAIAFGITAAVLLIGRREPALATTPSATPTASTVATPSASVAALDPASIPSVEQPADSNVVATNDKPVPGGSRPSTGGKITSSTAKTVDPSIADLLKGGSNGPSVGGGGGGGGGAGSALTQGEIEGVVNNRKTAVTRTCWEKSGGNVSAANVTCHVTIAANGSVSSASAEGSDPVITKCIEQQVKGWQFPPSSGSTQVNLPFHFVRQ